MKSLQDRRVLVLEDEYLLAEDLQWMLEHEGATVIGPFSSLLQGQRSSLEQLDGAILNVRIRDGLSYPFAEQLRQRGVPFVFASEQDHSLKPAEWRNNDWLTKPYEARKLVAALLRAMGMSETA